MSGLVVLWTTFPPSSTTPSPQPTTALRNPPATASPRNRAEPRRHQIVWPRRSSRVWKNQGRDRQKRRTSSRQAVVAKSSASAAGVSTMITRSKLVEQLRDYQIRSQHKRDVIGAISWGLLCCFLIISSYMTLYFRHFWLSAIIISLGILLPAGLYILRQRKLAKKRERRLLLPLSV